MIVEPHIHMAPFIIEGDNTLPSVILDAEKNMFEISGKSVPEDAEPFYNQILNWLDTYMVTPNEETKFIFKMDYFNIASSKRLLFILYKLNEMQESNFKVKVEWHYKEEDDDMFEVGQDFAYMVKVPFTFVACKPVVEEYSLLSLN